jgi:hypothetical protein
VVAGRELEDAPELGIAEDEGVVAARRLRRREAPLSAPETAGERGQRHRSHLPEQLEVVEVRAPRDVLHGEAEAAAPRRKRLRAGVDVSLITKAEGEPGRSGRDG